MLSIEEAREKVRRTNAVAPPDVVMVETEDGRQIEVVATREGITKLGERALFLVVRSV